MVNTHRLHHQPMRSPIEPHMRYNRIDLGASRSILLIVYKALISTVIDYGCMSYDKTAAKTKENWTGFKDML